MAEDNVIVDTTLNQSGGNNPEPQVPAPVPERTFTQTEVSNMCTKEKRTGENRILKMFGLNADTEVIPFLESHNNLNSQLSNTTNELNSLKNEKTLLSKGVPSDYVEFVGFKASQLVDDKTDFNTAVDNFLNENPMYSNTAKKGMSVSFGKPQEPNGVALTPNEKMNELIRKSRG